MGALNYNLKKLLLSDPRQRAELLTTNFASMEAGYIRKELKLVCALRPNLNKYVYHTSLNFHQDDDLDNEKLLKIAHEYLERMGFTNNQYFIFRHHDSNHPHLHLLAHRIMFDGNVVSDANNYKRSEQVLRDIEKRYNLVQVNPSKTSRMHAPTKDELEMVVRTGKPSNRMLLQEKMKSLLADSRTVSELITKGQPVGVHFLFNLQSTGRVSGITYFFEGFKIKGQHLGNHFKWTELIKRVNYEQIRDSQTISEANSRTREIYGTGIGTAESDLRRDGGRGSEGLYKGDTVDIGYGSQEQQTIRQDSQRDSSDKENAVAGNDSLRSDASDYGHFDPQIEITDDVDDELVYGKRRKRGYDSGHSR